MEFPQPGGERSQLNGSSDGNRAGNVVVTWPGFDADNPETGGLLRSVGLEVRLAPKVGVRDPSEVAALVGPAVAAIVSTDPFDESVFKAARRLRVIARVGVGTDSIDLDAATRAGVVITRTLGANSETTADHTLAMMLAATRRLIEHDDSVRRREWDRAGARTAWELYGTTVGLVGFGTIGRAVARRLHGFDATVLVTDPALQRGEVDGVRVVGLDQLLARSDIVSLHLPLRDSTRGIIGASELRRMRPEAILVNVARGGLVDEASLARSLADGHLRAAAIDVFEHEPPVSSDLLALHNVVLSPHIGGLSVASIATMTEQAVQCVLGVLQGRPPVDVVANPAVLANAPDLNRAGI